MGIRYDCKLMIKATKTMKEEAEKRALETGKTLSAYVRDLIVNDIKKD